MNIGIGGNLSGGKTILAIAFLVEEFTNKKIISTINLVGFKDYIHLTSEQFADFIQEYKDDYEALETMFKDTVLLLDEARNLISARKSTSNLNEMITQFLMMAGKLDCDVIYTFQLLNSQIDMQLREITNVFFECERLGIDKKPLPFQYARMRIPKDKEGNLIPTIIMVTLMQNDKKGELVKSKKKFFIDPLKYKDFYNTRELVILDREKYLKR